MLVPPQGSGRQGFTAAEIAGMAGTVARVLEAVAEIAERETRRPKGLVERGSLTRDGVDAATELMGMSPVSDEEWEGLRRPPMGDAP